MATYYVRKTGSDSNAGTSAGAAWLTIAKAILNMVSGDICYIGAGIYSETRDTATTDKTSATRLVGDIDGTHTGDPGEVIVSAWTSGFTGVPAMAKTLNLGRFWQIENLTVYGGGDWASASFAAVFLFRDNKVINCTIASLGDSPAIQIQNLTTNPSNILVEKTHLIGMLEIFYVTLGAFSGSGDIDSNIIIRNNIFKGQLQEGGGICNINNVSSRKVGGVLLYHNTFLPNTSGVITAEGMSTTFPCIAKYNIIPCGVTAGSPSTPSFYSDTAGSLIEDYNFLYGPQISGDAFYQGVTPGTHTVQFSDFCLLDLGHRQKYGMSIHDMYAPVKDSPLVQMFNDGSDPVTDDLYGNPRPSGAKTPGAVEPRRGWNRETGTVRTGSNSVSITGWGYQDFDVAVDAVSTTFSVYMRYDSTYTGTKPQFQVLNGTECGVSNATSTMAGAANQWEQLTLTFTPTSKGIVTLRLISNDTSGVGKAFADDRSVT